MKLLDLALHDLVRSLRSTFMIGMTVVAPLLITGLIYFAFSGMASGGSSDLPAVRVGIVNADSLPAGAPLSESLGATMRGMFFDESVATWITASDYPDAAAGRAAVDRQEIGVAVVIPAAFTADLLAGREGAPLTLIQDPTLTVTPLVVRNMLVSLLDGVSGGGIAIETIRERQEAAGLPADPAQIPALIAQYETWYADFQRDLFHHPERAALVTRPLAVDQATTNPMANLLGMTMVGQMIFFAFFTGAYAMMSILREQEEGTLARLFTTPTDRTTILAGKFLAVVLTVVLQGLVLMTAGRLAFGVDWGDPAAAALALSGQVIAASGLGVLLIALVKDTRQAGPVLGGGLTTLGMLSGLFTANMPNMPAFFDQIGAFTPQGWVLRGWRMVLEGGAAGELLLPLAVCLGMGAVLFALGAVLFRRRFA